MSVSYTIGLIRYAITDAEWSAGQARRLAEDGVDFLQLREKGLDAAALVERARALQAEVAGSATRLLINGRADVALAAGAAGVHLTAHPDELTVQEVRWVLARGGAPAPVVSVSCHTMDAALRAKESGADMVLFAPVFEKQMNGELVTPGAGLARLHEVCAALAPLKVLALGGVSAETAALCVDAGAAGVAGIRMFSGRRLQSRWCGQ